MKKLLTMSETTFNQRFTQILQHYNLRSTDAAKKMRMNRQVTDSYLNGSLPRLDSLATLLETFPDLNTDWVIFGKGDMLKSGPLMAEESRPPYGDYVKRADYERLEKLFDVIREELDRCRQELKEFKDIPKSKTAG